MITDVIIMAGGYGERLWPATTDKMPKQFLALNNNITFIQESIKRALALNLKGKIIIVTRKDIEKECTNQCHKLALTLDDKNKNKVLNDVIVLAEPEGKHTSAAIMSGVILLNKTSNQFKHTVLVLTSDHIIGPIETFVKDCETASKAAEESNFVCFSIPPTKPSTGYGYIKTGHNIYEDGSVYKIEQFKEKPDLETAKKYYSSKEYFWNSGMFAFESNFFLNEMKLCTPEISESFSTMLNGSIPKLTKFNDISIIASWPELEKTYKTVPNIAVDKAIAEKTTKAVAVKSNFNWVDVGSWDTFSELCINPSNEKVIEVNSNNNFIYSDIPVALCGVEDLVVVAKNGKLLIMKKGNSSLVREASSKMKEK